MKWTDVNEKLPKEHEIVLFWVKWENSIWHAKTGWVKMQSDGPIIIIPSSYHSDKRTVKCWTKITPPEGF